MVEKTYGSLLRTTEKIKSVTDVDMREILYVHGHTQCEMCRQIIDDCCQGEMCEKK